MSEQNKLLMHHAIVSGHSNVAWSVRAWPVVRPVLPVGGDFIVRGAEGCRVHRRPIAARAIAAAKLKGHGV